MWARHADVNDRLNQMAKQGWVLHTIRPNVGKNEVKGQHMTFERDKERDFEE